MNVLMTSLIGSDMQIQEVNLALQEEELMRSVVSVYLIRVYLSSNSFLINIRLRDLDWRRRVPNQQAAALKEEI